MEERQSTEKLANKIWNVVCWVLIAMVVLIAIALGGVRIFGLRPFAVLSGSMEPTYKTGSVIYVKKVDYHDLEVGDPITFMVDEKTVATHRIVEIVPDEENPDILRYRTKGDNNDSEDGGAVHCNNIIGRPVFSIPYLGYISNYIQNPPGTFVAIAVVAILIILIFIPDIFKQDDGKNKKTSEPKTEDTLSE